MRPSDGRFLFWQPFNTCSIRTVSGQYFYRSRNLTTGSLLRRTPGRNHLRNPPPYLRRRSTLRFSNVEITKACAKSDQRAINYNLMGYKVSQSTVPVSYRTTRDGSAAHLLLPPPVKVLQIVFNRAIRLATPAKESVAATGRTRMSPSRVFFY